MDTEKSDDLDVSQDVNFCQVVSKEIRGSQCLEMQDSTECFGCAATSRLCESCQANQVDIPAVGLCSTCATAKLESERTNGKNPLEPNSKIKCQLFKRTVSLDVCIASQGADGCAKCSAPSRMCKKCKEHAVKFSKYGLCLKCSIEEYGEGWNLETASLPIRIKKLPIKEAESISGDNLRSKEIEKLTELIATANKDEIEKMLPSITANRKIKKAYRKQVTAKLIKGRHKRIRNGKMAGGNVPYGYDRNGEDIQKNLQEVEIVQWIFHMAAKQRTGGKIAMCLNQLGYQMRNGQPWTQRQVCRILNRKDLYEKGIIRYGESSGKNLNLIIIKGEGRLNARMQKAPLSVIFGISQG